MGGGDEVCHMRGEISQLISMPPTLFVFSKKTGKKSTNFQKKQHFS